MIPAAVGVTIAGVVLFQVYNATFIPSRNTASQTGLRNVDRPTDSTNSQREPSHVATQDTKHTEKQVEDPVVEAIIKNTFGLDKQLEVLR